MSLACYSDSPGRASTRTRSSKSPAAALAPCNGNCHAGSQKHYQANPESPLFKELCAILTKTVALVEPLKTALEPILPKIELAFVFGSVAKGEDAASSDIDLMIISDSLTYADVFPGLEQASVGLGRALQPTLYPREELCKRISTENAFVKRVLAQPKIWVIGGESELPTG